MGKNQQKKIFISIMYQNQKTHDKTTILTVFTEINDKFEDGI